MNIRLSIFLFVFFLSLFCPGVQARADKFLDDVRETFEPLPKTPTEKPGNKLNKAKVELGKMLYFEPRLSRSDLISCNTCHNLAGSGTDNLETSIGHKWQKGPRNAPTVWNAALHFAQFWDGRAEDVEAQAQAPLLGEVEMASTRELVLARLKSIPEYVERFQRAFPGDKNPLTYKHVADAIGAFERTLLTPSRFDRFLEGDRKALSREEIKGLKVFMSNGCSDCHDGVTVGGQSFMPFGLENPYQHQKDPGRYKVTKDEEDKYFFKVPSLRNVELTYPYFHDGKVWTLREAVKTMAWTQLGKKLSGGDVASIITFLKTLTGTAMSMELPRLPPSTPATPAPVTDIP